MKGALGVCGLALVDQSRVVLLVAVHRVGDYGRHAHEEGVFSDWDGVFLLFTVTLITVADIQFFGEPGRPLAPSWNLEEGVRRLGLGLR